MKLQLKLMAWLWWTPLISALALPAVWQEASSRPVSKQLDARDDRTIVTDPDTGRQFVPGDTSSGRTVYTLVSLSCAVLLALLFGYRAKTLKRNVFRKVNAPSMLVVFLFGGALCFIISTSVVESGQSLRTHTLCYSAIIICLVFYTTNKLTIYIFLLERARIVRAPFVPRHKDLVWLSGMGIICSGFGAIMVVAFITPVVELSKTDGRCRIGLPPKVAFPLMGFDVGVNFLLTGIFIWLLKPVLSYHGLLSVSGLFGSAMTKKVQKKIRWQRQQEASNTRLSAVNKSIRTLLWKCLIGSTLIMFPTVGNMAQFCILEGRELGWICLTICTLDVSWGVLVVNWLTTGSASKAEEKLTSLMSQHTVSSEGFSPTLTRSRTNSMTVPAPVVLHDAGKLLTDDKSVTPIKRSEDT